jgi:hypothetical protein
VVEKKKVGEGERKGEWEKEGRRGRVWRRGERGAAKKNRYCSNLHVYILVLSNSLARR